jgi:hypothetical protein
MTTATARKRQRKATAEPTPEELEHILPQLRPLAVPIGALTIDPENARKHDKRNIESILSSVKAYKQRKTVVVKKDGMVVEAGNGTVVALKKGGFKYVAAVIVEESAEAAAGYAIADNRTAELAEWDVQALIDNCRKYELDPTEHAIGFTLEELGAYQLEVADFSDMQRINPDEAVDNSPIGDTDGTKPKCEKNGQWFYVEFYKQPEKFERLKAKLKPLMRTEHEIEADAFEQIIDGWRPAEEDEVEEDGEA